MTARRNVILTGFMGTGKSTIGRQLAARLGLPFLDMDEIIAERAGKSIPAIFEQDGEPCFRAMERSLCAELTKREGLVIATGGGTCVDEGNRNLLAATGHLICLDGSEDELLQRVSGNNSRPMLAAEDPDMRLRELHRQRQTAYAAIPLHVDTTFLSTVGVLESVLRLVHAEPSTHIVPTPLGEYPVHVFGNSLDYAGSWLRARQSSSQIVVVSDENIWPLHSTRLLASLRASGYEATPIVLPAGEGFKTLETVRILYDRFIQANVDRGSVIMALGGGVVTDMAGFAAASFMRGVPFVPIPSTLLGMVDASVGGKVAVDHPAGKNLIGAFIRPELVVIDPSLLDTLPEREWRAGLAEIIKAGIIADPELFAQLAHNAQMPDTRWMVERALQVKIDVVREDPYEHGRRAILNLGHTFAHAFEVLDDYRLPHGLAVSVGMAAAAQLALIRHQCTEATCDQIIHTLAKHGLPTHRPSQSANDVVMAMQRDKKRLGKQLRFILPEAIGKVVIVSDVTEDQVIRALERIE